MGQYHTCAISGGDLYCWGYNKYGQLGIGRFGYDFDSYSSRPVKVVNLTDASVVSAGDFHTCAISRGSLYCWGNNDFSQIGDGSSNSRNYISWKASPTLISTLTDVSAVSAGSTYTCAISRSSLYCWGRNESSGVSYIPQQVITCTDACCMDPNYSNISTPCISGRGLCEARGIYECTGEKPTDVVKCSAVSGNPGEEIACNGVDDDCDGETDTDAAGYGVVCSNGLKGACARTGTLSVCTNGVLSCSAPIVAPIAEICGNGIDDDCDGEIDEDCADISETGLAAPQLKVKRRRIIALMQRFEQANEENLTFKYEVLIRQVSSRAKNRNTPRREIRVVESNRVVFRKRQKGTYRVRYRVNIYRDGVLLRNTEWSPFATTSVPKK